MGKGEGLRLRGVFRPRNDDDRRDTDDRFKKTTEPSSGRFCRLFTYTYNASFVLLFLFRRVPLSFLFHVGECTAHSTERNWASNHLKEKKQKKQTNTREPIPLHLPFTLFFSSLPSFKLNPPFPPLLNLLKC